MKNKETVYVLIETDPDYISTTVYRDYDNAISGLKEIAEENDMEYHEGDSDAFSSDRYAEVRSETLN